MEFVPAVPTSDRSFRMDDTGGLSAAGPILARVSHHQVLNEEPKHSVFFEVGGDGGLYGPGVVGGRFNGDELVSEGVRFSMGDDGVVVRRKSLGALEQRIVLGNVHAAPACLKGAKRTALLMVMIELARPLPLDMNVN